MTVFEVLSLLAILISTVTALFVGFVEFRRYYLHLKMAVHDWQIICHSENSSIFLFNMSFVNPSTRGKTIYHAQLSTQEGLIVSEIPGECDEENPIDICVFPLPNDVTSRPEYRMETSRVLPMPIDVLPHQSFSGHMCYRIDWASVDCAINKLSILFRVLDIDEHILASYSVSLTLTELKTDGYHNVVNRFEQ